MICVARMVRQRTYVRPDPWHIIADSRCYSHVQNVLMLCEQIIATINSRYVGGDTIEKNMSAFCPRCAEVARQQNMQWIHIDGANYSGWEG